VSAENELGYSRVSNQLLILIDDTFCY
jgi:hypothetical protein